MPVLFPGPAGKVLAVTDPSEQGVLPALVNVERQLTFRQRRAIITRVQVACGTNQQFLHTLGGDIYIYVFGDRVGEMTISGICFAYDCDSGDREHGAEKMYRYYQQNRLSVRAAPVRVSLGRTVIEGFLGSFSTDLYDPSLRLMQYNLGLFVMPEKY